MSTTQASPVPSGSNVVKEQKVYSYFSPDTFESVSETVDVTFNKPTDLQDAMARIGNDQSIVLKALTSWLQRQTYAEAKRQVLGKGISKKIVLSVLRPFRSLSPWSAIEDRKAQTEELLKAVRSNPGLLEMIKTASMAAVASDTDDDDDEGSEE